MQKKKDGSTHTRMLMMAISRWRDMNNFHFPLYTFWSFLIFVFAIKHTFTFLKKPELRKFGNRLLCIEHYYMPCLAKGGLIYLHSHAVIGEIDATPI